jgi:hypothetical protein
MRRIPTLGIAAVLLLGGGTGLVVDSLSSGSAGADTTLGGFTVSGLAEAITVQYEQPNFPLPSNPSLEFDEGYAATSDNFGPSGSATASTLYPGQVVANAGPQLALLLPGLPLPPAPVWPVQAVSGYPQTPNTASTDEPGVNMDAISSTNGSEATATIGTNTPTAGADTGTAGLLPGLPSITSLTGVLGSLTGSSGTPAAANPLGAASSIIGIGVSSGTSSAGASGATATATAVATDTGISVLGGLINIGGVTTTATATSDGTTGKVTGSTVLTNVNIAGEVVTIDSSGLHAAGQTAGAGTVVSSLNKILNELGITLTVTNATDTVMGPAASRTLDGLKLTINLDTLDTAAAKFSSLLPASLTSQLPVAIPNMQLITLDLGTVTVSSTASPAFTDTGDSGSASGNTGNTGSGLSAQSLGASTGNSGSGSFGGTGSSGAGAAAGTTAPGTSGGTPTGTSSEPTSAVTPVFKGIGSGLILLGLLAAAALAYAYKRADDATELVGTSCADGDPLADRFSDDPAGGLV